MLSSKDTHPKHLSNQKLKQEIATTNMDLNNRGGLQKGIALNNHDKSTYLITQTTPITPYTESPPPLPHNTITTTTESPSPPPLHHDHHHHCNTIVQQAQEQDSEAESLEGKQQHHHNIPKKQPWWIYPQTSDKDINYAAKPPHQDTGINQTQINRKMNSNNNTRAATPIWSGNSNPDVKAPTSDKEKASIAEVNNNQTKKQQEPTNTTQKGPKKF